MASVIETIETYNALRARQIVSPGDTVTLRAENFLKMKPADASGVVISARRLPCGDWSYIVRCGKKQLTITYDDIIEVKNAKKDSD